MAAAAASVVVGEDNPAPLQPGYPFIHLGRVGGRAGKAPAGAAEECPYFPTVVLRGSTIISKVNNLFFC